MQKFLSISNKSLVEFGVKNYQELWKSAKKQGYKGLTVLVKTEMTRSAENKFHAIFSTANEDRHGDIVYQNWDLKAFQNNPVYLDSHNYSGIEHILGRIEGIKADKLLEGDIVYALDNPKGLLAYNLTQKGFLNTSSVGFIPKEFDKDGNILRSELLEISAVSVPANADALIDSKKSFEGGEPAEKKVTVNETLAKMAQKKIKSINKLAMAVRSLKVEKETSQKENVFKALRKLEAEILDN
jgi:HK97 family phage prohead protease